MIEYFIIYEIGKDFIRPIMADNCMAYYYTFGAAQLVKEQLQKKNPDLHYHIRPFNFEDKFIEEMK